MSRYAWVLGVFAATALLLEGCESPTSTGGSDRDAAPAAPTSQSRASPEFDPSAFGNAIDNPYFPLIPGTAFHYRGETDDGVETNDLLVTHDTKQILGVTTTVIHDQVFLDGELIEDTFDWFAQDADGNVWYFGEDSKEIENGQVVSTEGSWQAGVDGAQPGIVMLAHPHPGVSYRQELAPSIAEDMARVLGLKASPTVPYGKFEGCLHTLEWTPLEVGVREHKFYCPGLGLVLITHPKGGNIREELVSITHF
jgi:hypothetical protein